MKKMIIAATLMCAYSTVYADAFKCTVDGKTVYQQSPCENNKGVVITNNGINKSLEEIENQKKKERERDILILNNHPLNPPKSSDELQKWIEVESKFSKEVQEARVKERRKVADQEAMNDPEKIKTRAKLENLKTGNGFKIGMSEEDLLVLWGEPTKVNTSVTANGVSKQMIYDDPCKVLRMGNECLYKSRIVYSENGVITSLQY